MGCSSSRSDVSNIEFFFERAEMTLGYSELSTSLIDFTTRKYSHEGYINESQWQSIFIQLHLSLSEPANTSHAKIKTFYQQFFSDKKYSLQWLLTLGVLLSNDADETKSRILFETFDKENTKEIDKKTLESLLEVVIDIASEKVKVLIDFQETGYVTEEDYQEYVRMLRLGKEKFKDEQLSILLMGNNTCTLEGFVDKFRNNKRTMLLTASGVRKALKEKGKKIELGLGNDSDGKEEISQYTIERKR